MVVAGLETTRYFEGSPVQYDRIESMAIKTILVIEDDRFIGEMYVRSLKKAGSEVDWMVDGNDGLVAARNKQRNKGKFRRPA